MGNDQWSISRPQESSLIRQKVLWLPQKVNDSYWYWVCTYLSFSLTICLSFLSGSRSVLGNAPVISRVFDTLYIFLFASISPSLHAFQKSHSFKANMSKNPRSEQRKRERWMSWLLETQCSPLSSQLVQRPPTAQLFITSLFLELVDFVQAEDWNGHLHRPGHQNSPPYRCSMLSLRPDIITVSMFLHSSIITRNNWSQYSSVCTTRNADLLRATHPRVLPPSSSSPRWRSLLPPQRDVINTYHYSPTWRLS